jgi:hypothetical protein
MSFNQMYHIYDYSRSTGIRGWGYLAIKNRRDIVSVYRFWCSTKTKMHRSVVITYNLLNYPMDIEPGPIKYPIDGSPLLMAIARGGVSFLSYPA